MTSALLEEGGVRHRHVNMFACPRAYFGSPKMDDGLLVYLLEFVPLHQLWSVAQVSRCCRSFYRRRVCALLDLPPTERRSFWLGLVRVDYLSTRQAVIEGTHPTLNLLRDVLSGTQAGAHDRRLGQALIEELIKVCLPQDPRSGRIRLTDREDYPALVRAFLAPPPYQPRREPSLRMLLACPRVRHGVHLMVHRLLVVWRGYSGPPDLVRASLRNDQLFRTAFVPLLRRRVPVTAIDEYGWPMEDNWKRVPVYQRARPPSRYAVARFVERIVTNLDNVRDVYAFLERLQRHGYTMPRWLRQRLTERFRSCPSVVRLLTAVP